jgi:hypothetical protein
MEPTSLAPTYCMCRIVTELHSSPLCPISVLTSCLYHMEWCDGNIPGDTRGSLLRGSVPEYGTRRFQVGPPGLGIFFFRPFLIFSLVPSGLIVNG